MRKRSLLILLIFALLAQSLGLASAALLCYCMIIRNKTAAEKSEQIFE